MEKNEVLEKLREFESLFDAMSIMQKGTNFLVKTATSISEKLLKENEQLKAENEKLKKQLTDILMKEAK